MTRPSNERITRALAALTQWTEAPTTVEALEKLLSEFSQAELMGIAGASTSVTVGRIAWAELGRRRGYFDFVFKLSESTLDISAPAPAIHEGPVFTDPKGS